MARCRSLDPDRGDDRPYRAAGDPYLHDDEPAGDRRGGGVPARRAGSIRT